MKGFPKKDLVIKRLVNSGTYHIKSVIFNVLKKFFTQNFANSKFSLFFKKDKLNKVFAKKFILYFRSIYPLVFSEKQSFMEEIKNFYVRFLDWLFSYIYFVTKSKKSKILVGVFKKRFSGFLKNMIRNKLNSFSKCWFRFSQIKLFYFFHFLRVHLFDYSLMNISIKNVNLLHLFYNVFFHKNLFLLFSQSPYIMAHFAFLQYKVKKNINRFYKLINKKVITY